MLKPGAPEIAALHFRLSRLFCRHDNESGSGKRVEPAGLELPRPD